MHFGEPISDLELIEIPFVLGILRLSLNSFLIGCKSTFLAKRIFDIFQDNVLNGSVVDLSVGTVLRGIQIDDEASAEMVLAADEVTN